MYDASVDPYCYPGTTILKNIPDLRDQGALEKFEAAMTAQRSDEPLPAGRFTVQHYRAIHHHLFQDVYSWAGKFRTVRLAKEGSAFCYPENIARETENLFASLRTKHQFRDLPHERFASEAATFLATLNAIHPFREGNGRTQLAFLMLLADRAGHPFDLARLHPTNSLPRWFRVSKEMNSRWRSNCCISSAEAEIAPSPSIRQNKSFRITAHVQLVVKPQFPTR